MAEQGIAILLGPVCKVGDEVLDLLPRGFAQSLRAAEVDGVGLHQTRIELVLANQLAEAVADFRATIISVRRLRWDLAAARLKAGPI